MKGIIFDFNGTLFLDNDKHVKAWSAIANEVRGKPVNEQELHEHMNGVPNQMIIRYLNGGNADEGLERKFSEKKEAFYREFCKEDKDRFHLIEGASSLFDALQDAGIPFTIASASIKPNIDFFVDSFHLDNWMDPEKIVYDDGTFANKEAMFEKAAENLALPLEDMIVVEDSFAGIRAAIADGINSIYVINSGNIANAVQNLPQIKGIGETMSDLKDRIVKDAVLQA